jgi:hypothetical protein
VTLLHEASDESEADLAYRCSDYCRPTALQYSELAQGVKNPVGKTSPGQINLTTITVLIARLGEHGSRQPLPD